MSPDERRTLRAVCEAGLQNATVLLPKSVVLALLDLADKAEPIPELDPAERGFPDGLLTDLAMIAEAQKRCPWKHDGGPCIGPVADCTPASCRYVLAAWDSRYDVSKIATAEGTAAP
jgi:hypothetical protein